MERDAGCYYLGGGSCNDWDLNAVVRYACRGRVPPPPPSDDPFFSFFPPPAPAVEDQGLPHAAALLPDPPVIAGSDAVDELSIAFFAPSSTGTLLPTSPQPPPQQPAALTNQEMVPMQQDEPVPPPMLQAAGGQGPAGEGSRSKRKKKVVKKVVKRVAADGTSADPWAWRKYGQKPIKGSPYPRGYYRCSTDKACEARKMVERCRDDPNSFILTYTGGEHSHPAPAHRNSLAGTTRNRQAPEPAARQGAPASKATGESSSAVAAPEPSPGQSTSGGMSPTTPLRTPSMEEEYNQEEELEEAAGGASRPPEDAEMAREDELKKLLQGCVHPRDDPGIFVEETFVVTPWVTALGGAAGWS